MLEQTFKNPTEYFDISADGSMKVKPDKLKDYLKEALKLSPASVKRTLFQKDKSDLKRTAPSLPNFEQASSC